MNQKNGRATAVSLPGILAGICGLGFLYAFVRYPALAYRQSRFMQLIFMSASAVMTAWGLYQVFRGTGPSRRACSKRGVSSPENFYRRISWLGIILVLVGTELIYAITSRTANTYFLVLGVIAGCLFILRGIREIVQTIRPSIKTGQPRNRQALPLQGAVILVMMGVMFVGSLVGRSNMLMLVFTLMAGPFVVNGWMTFTMLKRTRIRRVVPQKMMAGDRVEVDLVLENGKRWLSSWLMDATDQIQGNGESLATGVMFACVPPRSSRTGKYSIRLMQRGKYRLGPTVITTRFPLGFVERGLEFSNTDDILVYPRLGEMLPAWKQERMTNTELVQQRDAHAGIYDDEFHRMREFRWGDNPRAIHWRTSARRNKLMMREFHQTREQDFTILLDLWIPEKPTDDDWERVERAVSFVATVGIEQMRDSRDSKIVLLSVGQSETRWEGHAGPAGFDSFLEALAIVQPETKPNRDWLWGAAKGTSTPATRTVLVTTREETSSGSATDFENTAFEKEHSLDSWAGSVQTIVANEQGTSRYFRLTP